MENTQQSFRYGILCPNGPLKEWQARSIQALTAIQGVHCVLLLSWEATGSAKLRQPAVLWSIYRRLLVRPIAERPVDRDRYLPGVPEMRISPTQSADGFWFLQETDLSQIRQYDLDIILHLGDQPLKGGILTLPRCGVWSYCYGEAGAGEDHGGPPFFWEVFTGTPVVTVALQRLGEHPEKNAVLKRGYFKALQHSYTGTLHSTLMGSSHFAAQVCTDILNGNAGYLDKESVNSLHPTYPSPNNLQTLRFIARLMKNAADGLCGPLFRHGQWNIGVVRAPIQAFLDSNTRPEIAWLPDSGESRFAADPFAISRENRLSILFEDFPYIEGKGRISCIELPDGKTAAPAVVAMEMPVHMSYPYVFEHAEEIYCVPETYQACEVRLYKALDFPLQWTHVSTLLKGFAACDSTLFSYQGRWWLACTDRRENAGLKLFLWHAPDLLGPWEPHVANPVKTDIRSSRPGGTPFLHEGYLYRPAQDCSRSYGGRIVLNRIVKLTPVEFEEEQAAVIEPSPDGPYPAGMHTISAAGEYTIVDGLRYTFNKVAFQAIFQRRARQALSHARRLARRPTRVSVDPDMALPSDPIGGRRA